MTPFPTKSCYADDERGSAMKKIGYLFVDCEDARTREHCKAQKLKRLKEFFLELGIQDAVIYIDEVPDGETQQRPCLVELLSAIKSSPTEIFVVTGIFELGNDFIECLNTLKILSSHNVRIFMIDNNIDTACIQAHAAKIHEP